LLPWMRRHRGGPARRFFRWPRRMMARLRRARRGLAVR
jgi:hypothetical protein